MPAINPTEKISFRLPKLMEEEWREWMGQAETMGLSPRDWLFVQVRAALTPKPKPVQSPLAQLNRGRQQGLMMGRLDTAWRSGHPERLSVSSVLSWCQKHPDDVLDVVQWCVAQSYGQAFDQWWESQVAPYLAPANDRTRGEFR